LQLLCESFKSHQNLAFDDAYDHEATRSSVDSSKLVKNLLA